MNAKSQPGPEIPAASATLPSRESWFRRWWPVLVPAGLSTACLVVLATQQQEIGSLRREIDKLSAAVAAEKATPAVPRDDGTRRSQAKSDAEELVGLREKASKLSSEIGELEKMRAENNQLKAKLASASTAALSPEEVGAVEQAQETARRIQCINNLKQLGLAVRIWAGDNNDMYPSDFLSATNEMSTPIILHCPSDTSHEAATSWATFTAANNSYEWFLTPPNSPMEPTRVLTRCPIHGTVGLSDGSVQSGVAKEHPEWFVRRDGKLYMERPSQSGNSAPTR